MSKKQVFKSVDIEIKEIDDDNRTITAIGSKEQIDRDNEIIKLEGITLNDYKKNSVVLWSHQHSELPVGKAVGKMVWLDNKKLMFKIQFATEIENPKAEYVYRLYKGGYLKSFSIGFLPDYKTITYKEDKEGKQIRIINDATLLEISAVNVPANAGALIQTFEKAWGESVIDQAELEELLRGFPDEKISAEEKEIVTEEKDWLYLFHHMHVNPKDVLDIEELHHCDVYSKPNMTGDSYPQKHIKTGVKTIAHVIDTDDPKAVPKIMYDHLTNKINIKVKTIDGTKYAVMAGLVNKSMDIDKIYSKIQRLEEIILELSEKIVESKEVKEVVDDDIEDIYAELYDEFSNEEESLEEFLEEALE